MEEVTDKIGLVSGEVSCRWEKQEPENFRLKRRDIDRSTTANWRLKVNNPNANLWKIQYGWWWICQTSRWPVVFNADKNINKEQIPRWAKARQPFRICNSIFSASWSMGKI